MNKKAQDSLDQVARGFPTRTTPPAGRLAMIKTSGRRPLDPRNGRPSRAYDHERLFPVEPPAPPGAVPHPARRGECLGGPRPCPLVGCLYNNYLDVREGGAVRLTHPSRRPEDMPKKESCSLDVADFGPHTLDEVADILGLTRERIRQIEVRATARLYAGIMKLDPMLRILSSKGPLLTLRSRRAKMNP